MYTSIGYTSASIYQFTSKDVYMQKPVYAGEILQKEFLDPLGMSQSLFAKKTNCDIKTINKICRGHTAITARTAIAFAEVLGTTPEFWLHLQIATDLWDELNKPKK